MPDIVYRCSICESATAAWVHTLDGDASQFRVYGKGHIWGSPIETCQRCEDLLRTGDVERLVAVAPRDRGIVTVRDVDEQIRNSMLALVRADRGAIPLADWLPPGHAELVAEGFVPIGDVTGAVHLGRAWPAALRRAVPETRDGRRGLSDDELCWFVRSPWPSITVADVLDLLWSLTERDPTAPDRAPHEPEVEVAQLRDLLARDEAAIWALIRELDNPDR